MVDERLSIWGWETGTGARFAIIVDAWGRTGEIGGGKQSKGLGDGNVKGVCFCKFPAESHRAVPPWQPRLRDRSLRFEMKETTDNSGGDISGFQSPTVGVYTFTSESVLHA